MSKKLQEKQRKRLAEQAKRAQHQSAARRSNLITLGLALLVVAAVAFLIIRDRGGEAIAIPKGVTASEAGCGSVQEFPNEGREHLTDPSQEVEYDADPPTSGFHDPSPADAAFYPNTIRDETLVHNLEHGQIVVWYSPQATDDLKDDVEALVEGTNDEVGTEGLDPLLAAPYDNLPDDTNLALSAWRHSQSCASYSKEVVDDFRRRFQGQGPEDVGVPSL